MTAPSTLAPGGRLPDLALPSASGTGTVRLRPSGGRLIPVIARVHGPACEHCRAWLRALARQRDELRAWDGHVAVIVPAAAGDVRKMIREVPFPVAVDAEDAFAARTGLCGAAVVIADPWGEVFHVVDAGAGHDLPAAAEIVEWVRYLAIQCPECHGEAL